MMQWEIITEPLLGAVIGLVTNKIAVEMLFRPLNPIYIGKFHVPFTPGIIPKEKDHLGKAIGNAVGNSLLTPAIIKETLLSPKIELTIAAQLDLFVQHLVIDTTPVESKLQQILGNSTTIQTEDKIMELLIAKINHGLISMNLGEIVAAEVTSAVQAKTKGTMLSMMVNSNTLAPIAEEIKLRVNRYIEEHGEEKVEEFIHEEFISFMEQPLSTFLQDGNTDELKQSILKLYHTIVNQYAEQLLNTLDLSEIVEERICAMDVKEVKNLVLSIMKKELGAIVNLGALIGFLLGLVGLLT